MAGCGAWAGCNFWQLAYNTNRAWLCPIARISSELLGRGGLGAAICRGSGAAQQWQAATFVLLRTSCCSMKILLVEDEVKLSSFVRKGLEGEGYWVDAAFDGQLGLSMGLRGDYDLVI